MVETYLQLNTLQDEKEVLKREVSAIQATVDAEEATRSTLGVYSSLLASVQVEGEVLRREISTLQRKMDTDRATRSSLESTNAELQYKGK